MRKRRRGSVRTRRAGGAEPAQIRATVSRIDSASSNAESHRQWAVRGTAGIAAATGTATAQEEARDSAPTVVEAAPTGLLDARDGGSGYNDSGGYGGRGGYGGVAGQGGGGGRLRVAAANGDNASQGEDRGRWQDLRPSS